MTSLTARSTSIVLASAVATVIAVEVLLRVAGLPAGLDWPTNGAHAKAEMLESSGSEYNLVVLGDSAVNDAIDPAVLDQQLQAGACRSFNAAVDAGSPLAQTAWLEEVVLPTTQPRVIVYGLISQDFASGEFGRDYTEARASEDGWLAEADRTVSDKVVIVRDRPSLRDSNRWLGVAPPADDNLDDDGFDRTSARPKRGRDLGAPGVIADPFEPNETQEAALEAVLDEVEATDATLVLVAFGGTDEAFQIWGDPDDARADFARFVQSTADEHGAAFVDLTDLADHALYDDSVHAKLSGAESITGTLADRMPPSFSCQ